MDVLEGAGLLGAATAAGAINAIAGGGSLVSFPALLAAGYPAVTANVTNTVAIWPGTVGGSLGYRRELVVQRARLMGLLLPCIAGSLVGSIILLAAPESAFDAVVPFLIIFACTVLAFQDVLGDFAVHHKLGASEDGNRIPLSLQGLMFVVAVYGGYFGAGLGIVTLAFLGILIKDDLQRLNALKGLLALLINFVAVLYFAAFGPVQWGIAIVMACGALAGGYAGAGLARKLNRHVLRILVVAYGLVVAGILFVK
ncbi:MAG TPA: sulfite exporter TauE/SafE family protein [Dehalococcoidia bacterium]|nr:sulfite exporter TauE/SafE family protein [Dehalococcoidia bacterium]